VRQQVQGLRFGVVQIVVHDSKVTQIERTEKTRLLGMGTAAIGSTKPGLVTDPQTSADELQ